MTLTPRKLNTYILAKLPLAFLAGIRVKELDDKKCVVCVRYKWINQNPFKSMYWAVQGMAAELATGALLLRIINNKNLNMSTLVVKNSAEYFKKATGKICFDCNSHEAIERAIESAKNNNESQIIDISVEGFNEEDIVVSSFVFSWSIKPK